MNETIQNAQHNIGTAIDLSFYRLEAIAKQAAAYRAEREKISAYTDYTPEARKNMIDRAAESYTKAISPEIAAIMSQIETIGQALTEMENTLDMGVDLQNALSVAKLGEALPSKSRFALFEQFRGQPQQLGILGAAFESAGVASAPYVKPMTFKADRVVSDLEGAVRRVASADAGETSDAWRLSQQLEELSKRVGADTPRAAKDLTGLDGGLEQAIREACGLLVKTGLLWPATWPVVRYTILLP